MQITLSEKNLAIKHDCSYSLLDLSHTFLSICHLLFFASDPCMCTSPPTHTHVHTPLQLH